MNDILEMIDDLNAIETLVGHPAFEETLDRIREKYQDRFAYYEQEMERQFEMNFMK